MVVNNLIEHLMYTGLSEYEGRVYIALLKQSPSTAYEAAKTAGVPTSKVYEVMARLEDKGIVSRMGQGRAVKYVPLPPEEFLQSRRTMMQSTLELLRNELPVLGHEPEVSYIWNLSGHTALMEKAFSLISMARQTLLISVWPEEVRVLSDALFDAFRLHVRIATVHFGPLRGTPLPGQVYVHPIQDTIYTEKGGRGFCIVADSSSALMGTISPSSEAHGAYSANPGFVTLAQDYIKHDIYVMKMVKRYDREMVQRFGPHYELLRDVFKDNEAV